MRSPPSLESQQCKLQNDPHWTADRYGFALSAGQRLHETGGVFQGPPERSRLFLGQHDIARRFLDGRVYAGDGINRYALLANGIGVKLPEKGASAVGRHTLPLVCQGIEPLGDGGTPEGLDTDAANVRRPMLRP